MTPTPHDGLFKSVFSQTEHAAGMLRSALPPGLVKHIDFSTLTVCRDSFVDQALKERHADLLFSAQVAGREAYFYFLAEHLSTVVALMGLRLLSYEVRIWEGWVSEHPSATRLPPIIPLVVHHSATGWTAEVAFEALLDVDLEVFREIAPFVPRFRFLLEDLSAASDEALRTRAMSALGRLVLWCLKNARSPEQIVLGIRSWLDLVRQVREAPNGGAALEAIWTYILLVSERFGSENLFGRLMQAVDEEGKKEMATIADELREEGERRGERKLLLKQLRMRFGDLPSYVRERVSAADPALLERWAERVLSEPTLDKVLESA